MADLRSWKCGNSQLKDTLGLAHLVYSHLKPTPERDTLLTGGNDAKVRLWDVASGKELRHADGHAGIVHCVAFLPQRGRAISGGADNMLRVWDLDTGKELARLEGHSRAVQSVAVCGNGCHVLSGGHDGKMIYWDLRPAITPLSKPRNPFDLARDVPKPHGDDVKAYAATWALKGKTDDLNAAAWVKEKGDGSPESLDGPWQMRWANFNPKAKTGLGPWTNGTAQVRVVGDAVFIACSDVNGETWLIETKRDGPKLIGRYLNLRDDKDALPWVGLVVDPERIDGQWAGGRWDLRRKIK